MARSINFTVSQGAVDNQQTQLNISHAQALELKRLAGLDNVNLGRKSGVGLGYRLRTPKGTEFEVKQFDTHTVWLQHQTDENAQKALQWAYNNRGASFEICEDEIEDEETGEIVSQPAVVALSFGGGKGKSSNAQPQSSMDDCPL